VSKGISNSFAKKEFRRVNLIIGTDSYSIDGFHFGRDATNEDMLYLTKDTLQVFHEMERSITSKTKIHLSPGEKILFTPEECQYFLNQLARCGQQAYQQFFFNKDAQEQISTLRSYPKSMKFAPTFYSNSIIFPWELLYEGDYKKVEVEMFWGFHYPISRCLTVNQIPKTQVLSSLDMLFCLHHQLNYAHEQEKPEIEKLIIKNKGKFYLLQVSKRITNLENGEELLEHFYENQYNVLHFACHCRPCRKYEDEVDALIISLQEDNKNHQIELEVKNFNLVRRNFQSQPLIFLNACQSAGGVDELRKTFNLPNMFIKYGAAAVIATACPMPDVFAAAFAKVFYEFFIGKKMLIGKALCETRRYFLEKYNNPLGLAYGLYSPHDYQIAQIPAMQAIAKQTKTPVGIG
jgi:hypothetical protein